MDFTRRVPKEYYEKMDGGRFEKITYPSVVYYDDNKPAVQKKALIYLPKEYDESEKSYKVLYLMHGGGGNEEEFFNHCAL